MKTAIQSKLRADSFWNDLSIKDRQDIIWEAIDQKSRMGGYVASLTMDMTRFNYKQDELAGYMGELLTPFNAWNYKTSYEVVTMAKDVIGKVEIKINWVNAI